MRKHRGMKPQDVLVLAKLVTWAKKSRWSLEALGEAIGLAQSEVSESLARSRLAGLVGRGGTDVVVKNFIQFSVHGLPYVFPVELEGGQRRGLPTGYGIELLKPQKGAFIPLVWNGTSGADFGYPIRPIYPSAPHAAKADLQLYELLALLDVIRLKPGRHGPQGFGKAALDPMKALEKRVRELVD
jgi:hypothetical protein